MLDFIGGILIDLSLLGGLILFALSFTQKFKNHKWKMVTASLILVLIGLIFFDTAAISEAYHNGVKTGENMIHN